VPCASRRMMPPRFTPGLASPPRRPQAPHQLPNRAPLNRLLRVPHRSRVLVSRALLSRYPARAGSRRPLGRSSNLRWVGSSPLAPFREGVLNDRSAAADNLTAFLPCFVPRGEPKLNLPCPGERLESPVHV